MNPEFERLGKSADDNELREWIEWAGGELEARDESRKEQARQKAQAILAKAADEARSLLERVGLPFEPGKPKRVRRAKPAYRAGQEYRHPDDTSLRWNGKGVRPGWVKQLERSGRSPQAVPVAGAPSSALA